MFTAVSVFTVSVCTSYFVPLSTSSKLCPEESKHTGFESRYCFKSYPREIFRWMKSLHRNISFDITFLHCQSNGKTADRMKLRIMYISKLREICQIPEITDHPQEDTRVLKRCTHAIQ
jgi:hypothetical protein